MQKYRYIDIASTRQEPTGRYTRYESAVQRKQETSVTDSPVHGSYGSLLFDPRWRSKRLKIITRDNGRCVICKGDEELLVHHRQYQFVKDSNAFKMPWDYADHLLITLCKSCHQRGHSKYKVPTLIL
jgi:5-methylcytosine-specific restriction endonuclease McrA